MTKDVRDDLNRIRKLSTKLNSATDEATELVHVIERFLNEECSFGLECSAIFWEKDFTCRPETEREVDEIDQDYTRSTSLAYCRVGSRFGIAVVTKSVGKSAPFAIIGEPDITPWSSCSREVKLAAFEYLPELLRDAVEQAEAMLKRTETTMADVMGIASALRSMVKS